MTDQLTAAQTLQKAYLEAASPDSVYRWLEAHVPSSAYGDGLPPPTLAALRDRRNRLVDLALGQFTTSADLLRELYGRGDPALCCAVLSNRFFGKISTVDRESLLKQPFFKSVEEFDTFLEEAPYSALEGLFTNPSLDPETLARVFAREDHYADLPDGRWQRIVAVAGRNPLLRQEYKPEPGVYSDGWAAYEHGKAITAAWSLLDTVPPTQDWATVLCQVFQNVIFDGVPREYRAPRTEELDAFLADGPPSSDEEADNENSGLESWAEREVQPIEVSFFSDVLARWTSSEEHREEFWNNFGSLRQLVASKAPPRNKVLQDFLRDHPDRYVRQGYYQSFQPSDVAAVRAAYDRDKEHFIEAAIANPWFYRKDSRDLRRLFQQLVDEASGALDAAAAADGSIDADLLRSGYYDRTEYWAKQNPREYVDWKYDDFEQDWDGEKTDQRWPTLVTELRDLIAATTNHDTDPGMIDDAVVRLRNRVRNLQDGHEARRDPEDRDGHLHGGADRRWSLGPFQLVRVITRHGAPCRRLLR